jgi:hypothetical protein
MATPDQQVNAPATSMSKGTRRGPNVGYIRPEFTDLKPRWDLIRDCLAGERQVKKRGDLYLPRPNVMDLSLENRSRYDQYLLRAVFYNVTGRTLAGLVGQVMQQEPESKMPTLLDPIVKDVDGAGNSLQQQVQKTLSLVLAHGRAGLFVDYPVAPQAATKAQLEAGDIRPSVILMEPWDVINWRTVTVGGVVKLALVVISEDYVTDDDGYQQEFAPQWRVLRLDEDGLYVQEEWIKDPNNDQEFILKPLPGTEGAGESYFEPTGGDGKRLNFIPFTFIGSVNNDSSPDLPPLYDMAALNIAHFRNSADYEEMCYIVGQATPCLAGLTEGWVKDVLKGTVQLGSRAAVMLPENASATLLQVGENTMPHEAMMDKEAQMRALGAKLVEQQKVQRTAKEASMENASEQCVLCTVACNVSDAYEAALAWALMFLGGGDGKPDDNLTYDLNTDFSVNQLDALAQAQLIAEWQAGAITDEEMRSSLTRTGIAWKTFEEWQQLREQEMLTKPITAFGAALAGTDPTTGAPLTAKQKMDQQQQGGTPPGAKQPGTGTPPPPPPPPAK